MEERPHKEYINEFFLGNVVGSDSRGELYNYDPVTGDARFCGTTASMCGVEAALEEQDEEKLEAAIKRILMLHAYMFTQSGIPVLYSGDEIGQLNDNEYTLVPEKAPDSRYIHRGKFQWDMAEKIREKGSVQERLFRGLCKLETIRKEENLFMANADSYTVDGGNNSVLIIGREYGDEKMLGIFNFSGEDQEVYLHEENDEYVNMLKKETITCTKKLLVKGNDFFWLKRA